MSEKYTASNRHYSGSDSGFATYIRDHHGGNYRDFANGGHCFACGDEGLATDGAILRVRDGLTYLDSDTTTFRADAGTVPRLTIGANAAGNYTYTTQYSEDGNSTFTQYVTDTTGYSVSTTDGYVIDAGDNIEINSSAGQILIGNDEVDQNMSFGALGDRTIQIGKNAAASTGALNEYAGSGNMIIEARNAGTIGIGNTGAADATGAISVATASARNISVGYNNAAQTGRIEIDGNTVAVRGHGDAGNVTIDAMGDGANNTGNVEINCDTAGSILVGTDAGGQTITIGYNNNASTQAVGIYGGSGNLALDTGANAGTINIGNTNANGVGVINFGTASYRTLNLGSTNGASTQAVVLRCGTGNMDIDSAANAGTISIGNTNANGVGALSVGTASAHPISIGRNNAASGAGSFDGSTLALRGHGDAGNVTIDAMCDGNNTTGNVEINVANAAGQIAIGNDTVNAAINVGTAGTRAIAIGYNNAAAGQGSFDGSDLILRSHGDGGNVEIDAMCDGNNNTGNVEINTANAAGNIYIGNDAINSAIQIGTGGTRTITIGNANATWVLGGANVANGANAGAVLLRAGNAASWWGPITLNGATRYILLST